jgi:hypothetical protein
MMMLMLDALVLGNALPSSCWSFFLSCTRRSGCRLHKSRAKGRSTFSTARLTINTNLIRIKYTHESGPWQESRSEASRQLTSPQWHPVPA